MLPAREIPQELPRRAEVDGLVWAALRSLDAILDRALWPESSRGDADGIRECLGRLADLAREKT